MIFANSSKSPSLGCSPSRARRACKLCSINLSMIFLLNPDTRHLKPDTLPLPRLCDHINYCGVTAIDDLDSFVESPTQLIRIRDRTEAVYAQRPRNRRNIRCRIFDANTDTFIFYRSLPPASHALLVLFVVVIGSVVQDDHEQWNFIFRRRPKRIRRHHEIAVANNADAEPSGSFVTKRR